MVLGCTHYPFLVDAFTEHLPDVRVLDPAPFAAVKLVDWLLRHPGFDDAGHSEGRVRVLCSGDPDRFRLHAERFLGEELAVVEQIAEIAGRLMPGELRAARKGQVVR